MTIAARCKHCHVEHRWLKLADGSYERISKSEIYCHCEPLILSTSERMTRELAGAANRRFSSRGGARKRR